SLLPTPYSLLPTPYSLLPTPYSLLPKTNYSLLYASDFVARSW
ncbi:MAG: amino acid ABC transporter permease, partial [Moorea sp. SIO3G5]|nr:amino acid ABC transporter permease [Moorena sp. SIO3G5]